jgi:flagellin
MAQELLRFLGRLSGHRLSTFYILVDGWKAQEFKMTAINTNVASLYAQSAITTNARQLTTTMQQLSTGKRINGAADDAAGIAISAKLTSQIRGLNQALRNANDAISMIQTAEGATDTITNMLQRMRELTIQSGNASYSNDDRTAMANEFNALGSEIDRIADTTKWNGFPILNATAGTSGRFMYDVDSGSGALGKIDITISSFKRGSTNGISVGRGSQVITSTMTASTAQALISKIDTSIKFVNTQRATMGATINRLQYTLDNLTSIETNTQASRSRIEDTDYSSATAQLSKNNVIQQAATAMLSQANQQPQTVLQLLKQ